MGIFLTLNSISLKGKKTFGIIYFLTSELWYFMFCGKITEDVTKALPQTGLLKSSFHVTLPRDRKKNRHVLKY